MGRPKMFHGGNIGGVLLKATFGGCLLLFALGDKTMAATLFKMERLKRELTQAELAARSGVPQRTPSTRRSQGPGGGFKDEPRGAFSHLLNRETPGDGGQNQGRRVRLVKPLSWNGCWISGEHRNENR